MTRLLTLIGLSLMAFPAHADQTLTGTWRTATYNGEYAHVRFDACADRTCGVIVRTFNETGEIQGGSLGKTLVINMQNQGGGTYADGRIRRPDTGQSAPLKMYLQGKQMKVSACLGPLCRNEMWTRVN